MNQTPHDPAAPAAADPTQPAIELVAVSKRYGSVVALKDVDLEIGQGEFLVLLGPSGCGKSTLLKLIAGLEDLTDGEVYIGGRLANYLRPGDRDVAMVFQNYALYPHMTVRDNLGFPLKMRKRPKAEVAERVATAANLLQLTTQLDKYPDEMSGGQRQRVALGRAIVREPLAFLMDEPLSNLDALLRVQMRTELLRLHRRVGRTTVYVTHDQVEAMTMADRVVVMQAGVIQQVGKPADVYRHPANLFVATFVGSPPMNLFAGQLVTRDGTCRSRVPSACRSGPSGRPRPTDPSRSASAPRRSPWAGLMTQAAFVRRSTSWKAWSPIPTSVRPSVHRLPQRSGSTPAPPSRKAIHDPPFRASRAAAVRRRRERTARSGGSG